MENVTNIAPLKFFQKFTLCKKYGVGTVTILVTGPDGPAYFTGSYTCIFLSFDLAVDKNFLDNAYCSQD